MLTVIKKLILAVFALLPDSPFPDMIDSILFEYDFLPCLNWFVPFDICAELMLTWLGCILIYYLFVMVKKVVVDFILGKVVSGISVALGALPK